MFLPDQLVKGPGAQTVGQRRQHFTIFFKYIRHPAFIHITAVCRKSPFTGPSALFHKEKQMATRKASPPLQLR
jgi:hypothetical protein